MRIMRSQQPALPAPPHPLMRVAAATSASPRYTRVSSWTRVNGSIFDTRRQPVHPASQSAYSVNPPPFLAQLGPRPSVPPFVRTYGPKDTRASHQAPSKAGSAFRVKEREGARAD